MRFKPSAHITAFLIGFHTVVQVYAADPYIGCGASGTVTTGVLPGCDTTTLGAGQNVLNTTIPNLINWAIGLFALVAMFFLIKAGIQLITSMGSPDKIKSATNTVKAALIGLILSTLAYILVSIVNNINFFS